MSAWLEDETGLIDGSVDEVDLEEIRVPGLTILAHPLSRRVGEQVALVTLASGRETHLSRVEPIFQHPEATFGEGLEEKHISRQPLVLAPGSELGSVQIHRAGSRTQVEIDGQDLGFTRNLSAAEIRRGVVLLLGRSVVLLLHEVPPVPSRPDLPDFGLVGQSQGMARVRRDILQVAGLGLPVLLRGETGTGKDLVARAIHETGERGARPFVAVNMGAIPPTLAASELFGNTRGAFTGAHHQRDGLFRHAHHGTLFLDEIGETPLEVQGLLLRALESGEIQPVGGVDRETVDVRVIAATDADIEQSIASRQFRGPLYHRLAGYRIQLPPLRRRREDLGALLQHFYDLSRSERGISGPPARIPAVIVARLARYHWPGNVRELRNVARRLSLALDDPAHGSLGSLVEELLEPITYSRLEHAPSGEPIPDARPPGEVESLGSGPAPRRRFRKPSEIGEDELIATLTAHAWSLHRAAGELRVSRATLYRLIESCSKIRKATEIGRGELEAALEGSGGDLRTAAARLQVSHHGLKIQKKKLGIG